MFSSLFTLLYLSLVSQVLGVAISPRYMLYARSNSGQATYYGGNISGGHCSFVGYSLPAGVYGVAAANWDNSAHCGGCVKVTYGGKSITAMIVDECPNCGINHLDLFPDAFKALANPTLGTINVVWDYVNCPISSPIKLHAKSGASQYWFSMQVINANQQIAKLEISKDGGKTWVATNRQAYNYFELGGGTGTSSVNVRLTSSSGAVLLVNNVSVSSEAVTTASGNFGGSQKSIKA